MIYLIQWTAGWMVLALHAWCIGACSVVSDSSQPQGGIPPSSSVHRILQARMLKWVAISYCRRSS